MELTVNTFSKGLQTDTHPMVQGSDTLSDALNATFITMNGNEVVLQNDMGNRRVDNAFLPAGYEPIGIKEYGGIIYIAAYNPITNKSLVGSFPSPERKIGVLDDDDLTGSFFDEELLKWYKEENLNGLICLVNDSILVPITGKNSLHAGDKFVIYSKDLDTIKDNLSNYYNTKNNKVYSPKNKKYTISIGILNSLNEFVDITKTLVRYHKNDSNPSKPHKFDEKVSDLYKFNYGYFICEAFDNEGFKETINDSNFINNRNLLPANTYSYKLIGPMYMQTKLNHISNFSYNIYGTYDNNTATLYVEGKAIYNCPDLITNTTPGVKVAESDIYYSYFTGVTLDFMFDFFQHSNGNLSYLNVGEKYDIKDVYTSYDLVSDLYTAKFVKKYTFENLESSIFEYVIGVRSGQEIEGVKIYLAGLSDKGIIDLNLLGSGTVNLNTWRFINKDNITTLTYSIQAYPEYEETLEYLELHLTDVTDTGKEIIIPELPISNGRLTVQINWGKEYLCSDGSISSLKEKTLYQVTLYFYSSKHGLKQVVLLDDSPVVEFLLTTDLFNSCYSLKSSNQDYIVNYGYPGGKPCNSIYITDIEDSDLEIRTFAKKITISPDIKFILLDNSKPIVKELKGSRLLPASKIQSDGTNKQTMIYTQTKELNYELRGEVKTSDLYPSYIEFPPIKSHNIKILNNGENNGVVSNIEEVKRYLAKLVDNPDDYIELVLTFKDNRITGEVVWKDIYTAEYDEFKGIIKNGFDSIKNYLNNIFPEEDEGMVVNTDYVSHSGIILDSIAETGPLDAHYVTFVLEYSHCRNRGDSGNREHSTLYADADVSIVYHWDKDISDNDGRIDEAKNNFKTSNPLIDLLSYFRKIEKSKVFAYIFDGIRNPNDENGNMQDNDDIYCINKSNGKSRGRLLLDAIPTKREIQERRIISLVDFSIKLNRVWWKTTDGTWALIDLLFGPKIWFTDGGLTFDDSFTPLADYNGYWAEHLDELTDLAVGDQIKKLFPLKGEHLYFCRYKEITSSGELYIANLSSLLYNDPYEYDFKVKVHFELQGDDIVNIGDTNITLLNFAPKTTNLDSDDLTLFKIKSSLDFYDYISGDIDTSNIDIHTGIGIDSDGRRFSSNSIYYSIGDKYRYIINPKIRSDASNNANENLLVCVPEHDKAITQAPVSFAGTWMLPKTEKPDDWTWLLYDKVERFSPYSLKELDLSTAGDNEENNRTITRSADRKPPERPLEEPNNNNP